MRVPTRINSITPGRFPIRKPLDPSCVLNLPFREGTGTIVNDQTIFQNNGTINGATWKPGRKIGSALSFNGTSDYVDCGNDASLDITDKITVEVWAFFKDVVTDQKLLSIGGMNKLILGVGEVDGKADIEFFNTGGQDIRPRGTVTLNSWNHIVGTYQSGIITGAGKMYVNGVLTEQKDSDGTALKSTSDNLWIGKTNFEALFNGTIDEVRIYNRALSAEEIKRLYLLTK